MKMKSLCKRFFVVLLVFVGGVMIFAVPAKAASLYGLSLQDWEYETVTTLDTPHARLTMLRLTADRNLYAGPLSITFSQTPESQANVLVYRLPFSNYKP